MSLRNAEDLTAWVEEPLTQFNLSQLGLSKTHTSVVKRLEGPKRLSYHNANHCYWVANMFYHLANKQLSPTSLREGYLSALYHDAGHPGNTNDTVNTLVSAQLFRKHSLQASKQPDQTFQINVDKVYDLIRSTSVRAPYATAPHITQLLKDADLLQTVVGPPDFQRFWLNALEQEQQRVITTEEGFEFVSTRLQTLTAREVLSRFS